MKKRLCLLFVMFLLAGCAGQDPMCPQYDVSGRFLDLATADLVKLKGNPGAVAVLPSGGTVWTYKSSMTSKDVGRKALSWVEVTSFIIGGDGRVISYTTAVER